MVEPSLVEMNLKRAIEDFLVANRDKIAKLDDGTLNFVRHAFDRGAAFGARMSVDAAHDVLQGVLQAAVVVRKETLDGVKPWRPG